MAPNQETYRRNGEEVPFEELPPTLQADILEAEDFDNKLKAASTQEEREEIINTHPYNQGQN
jgi:hypothetical protein